VRTRLRRALSAARSFWGEWWPFIAGGLLMAAAMLTACVPTEKRSTIEQTQRETVAGRANADVLRETQVQPPPVKVTTRDGTTIEMPAATTESVTARTEASENSDSAATGRAEDSVTIPLAVKLIAGGFGLIVIAVGVWMLMLLAKRSKAITAAFGAGDDLAARGIHSVRSLAATMTNADDRARILALAGDMERDRTNWHREP
jgi:hypothetical protein